MEKSNFQKKFENFKNSSCLSFVFCPKIAYNFLSISDFFVEITFHVHYEEVYKYKRFQKFNIKTLIKIGCPNFKNEQKTSQSNLEVKKVIVGSQSYLLGHQSQKVIALHSMGFVGL